MIGVIVFVDLDESSATLVDRDKKQYSFAFSECVGFDPFPRVGEKVEFDLSGGEIFFVEALKDKRLKETAHYKEKTHKNIQVEKRIELHADIPLDRDISDCLDNHFEEVISVVYEYEAEFKEGESLNFLLIKRFLHTAYNNLRDIDSTFMDRYLLELRSDLKVLESVYQKFHKKITNPETVYESIFLEQQATYKNHKKRMETNISEVYTLNTTIKSQEIQIKNIQKEIERCTTKKQIELKQVDLKRYNSYFVDSIHRLGSLKEENIQLKELLDKFTKKYRDEFIFIYIDEAKKYDEFLREQLDGYAYEFDKKMWQSAETSSAIRSFFKRAKIEDDFSSKTFLKYFIKGLDETKFSKEHKRLHSLLEYLEKRAKLRILIVSENRKKSDYIKHLIRSFCKEYSVEVSDNPRSSYYRKDLARLDIIFADLSMSNPIIYEYIDMMRKRVAQESGHTLLCVISDSFKKESLVKLKSRNVDHLLATNLLESELRLRLKELIDSIDG